MEQDTAKEMAVSPSLVLLACVPRNALHVRCGLGAACTLSETAGELEER